MDRILIILSYVIMDVVLLVGADLMVELELLPTVPTIIFVGIMLVLSAQIIISNIKELG